MVEDINNTVLTFLTLINTLMVCRFSIDGLERDPHIPSYQWDVIAYHRTGFQALKQGFVIEKLIPQRRRSFNDMLLTSSEKVEKT